MTEFTIDEWENKNKTLLQKMKEFEEKYHEEICAKKEESHKKTGCHEVDGVTFCSSLKAAKARKFKKEIDEQLTMLVQTNIPGLKV